LIKIVKLQKPFNIDEVVNPKNAQEYRPVVTFKKVQPSDEKLIEQYLKSINALD
jgi:hypothetical protein